MMGLKSRGRVKSHIVEILKTSYESAIRNKDLTGVGNPRFILEVPKREGQGDFATTLALSLASSEERPARDVASILVRNLSDREGILDQAEVAGPGFINFTIKTRWWCEELSGIIEAGDQYGLSSRGKGRRIQIEFVSANPTGPLHVGHGRWAAVGNAMANLLRANGSDVQTEYYINDAGRQIRLLGESIYAEYQRLCGIEAEGPEDGYHGGYIKELGTKLMEREGRLYAGKPLEECLSVFSSFGATEMLVLIKEDLENFGVQFDSWFSEMSLFEKGAIVEGLEDIRQKGYLYDHEGATWLKSTDFSDDKDRVVKKENGEYTYLASDIAYHKDKLSRGFDQLINIFGADHHGYVARMEAVIQALGYPKETLVTKIGQLVTLVRGTEPVPMSKRAGEYVTLKDVVNEVGKDAALFFFLMRRLDSHMEFDLELAKRQSSDNPVYYVQYAHARLSGVLRQAKERGIVLQSDSKINLERLSIPEEVALIRKLCFYPDLIEDATEALEPHRVVFYLQELAALLHNYYYQHRVISDDEELTQARLFLIRAIRVVVRNGLLILGVSAPDRM